MYGVARFGIVPWAIPGRLGASPPPWEVAMAQKKSSKSSESRTDKTKTEKKKTEKKKAEKPKAAKKPKATKKPKAAKKEAGTPEAQEIDPPRPILTEEDALAMAEALVEMFNEGAENPVAFFVSADDALGRELIQLQGGELEDMEGLVPVVLDAAQVRRYAMLTIADEMIWRRTPEEES